MPPMILDGIQRKTPKALSQSSAHDTASTIFKHPVPFASLSKEPKSNFIIALPARSHVEAKLGGPQNILKFDSSGMEASIPDSENDIEDGNTRFGRLHIDPLGAKSGSERGPFGIGHRSQTTDLEADDKFSLPIYPKSLEKGFNPPSQPYKEHVAVQDLLVEFKNQQTSTRPSDIEFELSGFSIYLPGTGYHAYELRGLQHLATRIGHSSFLFDGFLSVGNQHRYVRAVPFQICSIGNYGEDVHEVGSDIWLQSNLNSKANIYYRLKNPSPEYKKHHDSFLWLANLAKHFVDYALGAPERTVSIRNFRSDFSQWIKRHHAESPAFQDWYEQHGKDDFRGHVCRNIKFLFKESVGVEDELRAEPVFNEIMDMDSVPLQKMVEEKTIVTPFVYECFKDLRFGHHLKVMEIASAPRNQQKSQGGALNLTVDDHVRPANTEVRVEIPLAGSATSSRTIQTRFAPSTGSVTNRQRMINSIKPGDVLSVIKDGQDSVWKDEISRWKTIPDDCWYICVQAVYKASDGTREFDALWLYRPSDTMCAKMKYPFHNELFLSDNCTCSQKRISEEEVLNVVKVAWNGHPSERDNRLFIRQTYLENERFVTLKRSHKKCVHLQGKGHKDSITHEYPPGKTILAPPPRKSKFALEPYEVVKYITDGGREEIAVLRRLQRRQTVDGKGKPNELVYTEIFDKIPARKIEGTCLVRFYKESDITDNLIPPPYNRDGIGNAFYITTRLVGVYDIGALKPIEGNTPTTLLQGLLQLEPSAQLRGMDLYCGGGNFGRGLEDGGALRNEWAVDLNRSAIHTYWANLKDPKRTKMFFGSVNDLLSQALQGNPKKSPLIPSPGEVDFMSAGSPCQGFSLMNLQRSNEQSLRNQSLVASVAAYIDFYRPKYGILENVMSMAQKGRGRDEDVLSQLICAIVGLGYQVRMIVIDAWSCGNPQSRTRLFVSFAAPGMQPLEHPKLSHSHPPFKEQERSLGKLANGEGFGRRLRDPTAFEYVSAGNGIGDLPRIGDGSTYHCIAFPDHIMGSQLVAKQRRQIECIPKSPAGMTFSKAWNRGRGMLTLKQVAYFDIYDKSGNVKEVAGKTSQAWGRLNPKHIIPAMLSRIYICDARHGPTLHWEDDRSLTIMEARRAQGFLDSDILVGSSSEITRIVGNSVARGVALALGLSLHEAWVKNSPDGRDFSESLSPVASKDNVDTEVHSERRRLLPYVSRRSRHLIDFENESPQSEENLSLSTTPNEGSGDLENDEFYATRSENRRSLGGAALSNSAASSHKSATDSSGHVSGSESRAVDVRRAREALEALASLSSPADELAEITVDHFVSHLAVRGKQTQPSRTDLSSGFESQTKTLKRPLDSQLPDTTTTSPKRAHKFPRTMVPGPSSALPARISQTIPQSNKTSKITSPSRNGNEKVLNATALADRLSDLQRSLSQKTREHFLHRPQITFDDTSSGSDEDVKLIPAASFNLAASKAIYKQYERPREPAPQSTTIICLISDDEDEPENLPSKPVQRHKLPTTAKRSASDLAYPPRPRQTHASINNNSEVIAEGQDPFAKLPYPPRQQQASASTSGPASSPQPKPTYVPVDNSALDAYAQTNQYLKFDVHRRHGPKSTW